jgi:hypothetical protein
MGPVEIVTRVLGIYGRSKGPTWRPHPTHSRTSSLSQDGRPPASPDDDPA